MVNQAQSSAIQPIDPNQIAITIANHLTQEWNRGDGWAFAQPFAENADFVTVFGELLHSRQTIGTGHEQILSTIFKGSQVQYSVLDALLIDANTILAHLGGTTLVPQASILKGGQATITLVIQKIKDEWFVRAFHNTMVRALEIPDTERPPQ